MSSTMLPSTADCVSAGVERETAEEAATEASTAAAAAAAAAASGRRSTN